MNSKRLLARRGNMATVYSKMEGQWLVGTWIFLGQARKRTLRDDAYDFIFCDDAGRCERCTYFNATVVSLFNSNTRIVNISEISK